VRDHQFCILNSEPPGGQFPKDDLQPAVLDFHDRCTTASRAVTPLHRDIRR